MDIRTSRNYTKKERKLLCLILEKMKKQDDSNILITPRELAEFQMDSFGHLCRFFQNYLVLTKDGMVQCIQILKVMQQREDGSYSFVLSDELVRGRYYHIVETILSLTRKDSYLLYLLLIQHDNHLIINLDECKRILGYEGCYPRFYDFERFVLNLLKEDYDQHTDIELVYNKVKNKSFDNSRIMYIEFQLTDEQDEAVHESLDCVYYTKLSNPYVLQNEIYKFIQTNRLDVLNEYFFSPQLFLQLLKIKKGCSIKVNPKLHITCDKKGNIKMEFYHCRVYENEQ